MWIYPLLKGRVFNIKVLDDSRELLSNLISKYYEKTLDHDVTLWFILYKGKVKVQGESEGCIILMDIYEMFDAMEVWLVRIVVVKSAASGKNHC